MTMRIHAAPRIDRGLVLVIEGETVLRYCELRDIGKVDGASDPDRQIDVYLHPVEAALFDEWLSSQKRRLN